MYIDWEGRIKTNFVADNMMIYVENLKDLLKKKPKHQNTQNLLELISSLTEVSPWKRPLCWERLRTGGDGSKRG